MINFKELHKQYLASKYLGEYMYEDIENSSRAMQEMKQAKAWTMKDKIDQAVAQAEQQLTQAKRAREIFEKNPDLEELLILCSSQVFFVRR